jgi:hypothetical protein
LQLHGRNLLPCTYAIMQYCDARRRAREA